MFWLLWAVASATVLVLSAARTAGAFAEIRSFSGPRRQTLSIGRNVIKDANFAAAAGSDQGEHKNNDEVNVKVGPAGEIFFPKIVDGVKFNLFGIGRKGDEDKANGAFQPPPNSMNGKVVLITGASAGLGLESAKRLALAGATVVLSARTDEKATSSADAVRDYCRGKPSSGRGRVRGAFVYAEPDVRGISLDLDDFSSVRSFPDRYRDCMLSDLGGGEGGGSLCNLRKIDVLMNNAGGGGHLSRELTIDGYERTFQSCHLGHFLLTASLFEEGLLNHKIQMKKNSQEGCVVINVSSVSHRCAEAKHSKEDDQVTEYGYDFDNMNCEIAYSSEAYFQAKLANILFTKELQRRVDMQRQAGSQDTGLRLTAVSVEPGGVTTDIWRHSSLGYDPRTFRERLEEKEMIQQSKGRSLIERLTSQIFYRLCTQVERGANAQIWLAYLAASDTDDTETIQGGQHYDEYRTMVPVPQYAENEDYARRLWKISEEMADVKFDLSVSVS